MNGENLVDNLTPQIFLPWDRQTIAPSGGCGRRLRDPFRLIVRNGRVRSPPLLISCRAPQTDVTVHHFEETIGGRPYQIEVTPVSNRWRAQLRRTPGMPTAMMPFYGTTPEEAARQLAAWLTLAHRRQSSQPVTSPPAV